MPSDYSPGRWAKARWKESDLATLCEDLKQRHSERDIKAAVYRTLLQRRVNGKGAGTNVPAPFDRSQLIIKAMVGELQYMAQQMVAKITENRPTVQVNRISGIDADITKRADKQAADLERAVMGMWHAANGAVVQQEVAYEQVTQGVGHILSHEIAAGWGLPAREFYDELTDEEIDRLKLVQVDRAKDGGEAYSAYAERADLWERRKADARYKMALAGGSLFLMEAVSWDKIYADEDQLGYKVLALIEDVPCSAFGPHSEYLKGTDDYEYGIIEEQGKIIGGSSRGESTGDNKSSAKTVTLHRIFTRDEIYYYVTGSNSGGGRIVYFTKHDYGEVPLYAAPFLRTGRSAPEERFTGPLEPAYAYAPLINQLVTMMSNLVAYKGTPRLFVQLPDGSYLIDKDTGDPKTYAPDLIGNDPEVTDVIEDGGQVRSVNELLKDDGMMFNLIQFYTSRMDQVLPPPVSTGHGSDSGPAYGKRMQLAEHGRYLRPAVTGHAQACEGMFRMWIRTIRRRQEKVGILSVPGSRGNEKGRRYYIEVDPDAVTDNITVHQNPLTVEEQIVREQVGMEKLTAGLITKRMYYEDYAMEQDPDAVMFEIDVERLVERAWPQVEEMLLGLLQGVLPALVASQAPNAAQAVSEQLAGNMATTAGIYQPGVNAPGTPPTPAGLEATPQQPVVAGGY